MQSLYAHHLKILLPQTVLAEVAYLIDRSSGSKEVVSFLSGLKKSRLALSAVTEIDIDRVAEILAQYSDSRIDFVDATVMAMAERHQIREVLTIDHRDFRLFRPKHCESFKLLPE
jgi:uncharacterized protein